MLYWYQRARTADEHNRHIEYLIKMAQTRGAKLNDYLEYLGYLVSSPENLAARLLILPILEFQAMVETPSTVP